MNRQFDTGANRDTLKGKLEYSGFFSPGVMEIYAQYMHKHQTLKDGSTRAGDNWKKGMPQDVYLDSLIRHVMDVWLHEKREGISENLQDALCGILFNTMGLLYEKYVIAPSRGGTQLGAFPGEHLPPWGEFIHPDDINPNVTGQGVRVDPEVLEGLLRKGEDNFEEPIKDARYFHDVSDNWYGDKS